ncbi:MAG: 6-phosphofructokinase [Candidatus Brocadiales bacterium]
MQGRIGVLTGGGDAGGLNGVIKGIARTANSLGLKVVVIPNGYAGLYNLLEFESLTVLTESRVDSVLARIAGSEAGNSRVKIAKIDDKDKYTKINEGLKKHNIDSLIISGGDDTGNVMLDLVNNGVKQCIHVPKTMDLNLQTYSVGFDSAVNRVAAFVHDLRTTGQTHNRIMVVEVFGRNEGHVAFRAGIAADADAILIPEIPVDFDHLYEHFKKIYTRRINESDVNAGTYSIVVAEGILGEDGKQFIDTTIPPDSSGNPKLAGAGKAVKINLDKRLKKDLEIPEFMKEHGLFVKGQYEVPEIRISVPSHLIRCGFTSAYDVNFGVEAGASAVHLLQKKIFGVSVVGLDGLRIKYMPIKDAVLQRKVDLSQVEVFEHQGVCFGRKPKRFNPKFEQVNKAPDRYM